MTLIRPLLSHKQKARGMRGRGGRFGTRLESPVIYSQRLINFRLTSRLNRSIGFRTIIFCVLSSYLTIEEHILITIRTILNVSLSCTEKLDSSL